MRFVQLLQVSNESKPSKLCILLGPTPYMNDVTTSIPKSTASLHPNTRATLCYLDPNTSLLRVKNSSNRGQAISSM